MFELMVIEKDARRFIEESIELDKELTAMEIKDKKKGLITI